MYGPPQYAAPPAPPARTNQFAVASAVFTGLTVLCLLGAWLLFALATGEERIAAGWVAVFVILASFPVAFVGFALGIGAIATRAGKRGLALGITSTVLSGGWFLLGLGLWLFAVLHNSR